MARQECVLVSPHSCYAKRAAFHAQLLVEVALYSLRGILVGTCVLLLYSNQARDCCWIMFAWGAARSLCTGPSSCAPPMTGVVQDLGHILAVA